MGKWEKIQEPFPLGSFGVNIRATGVIPTATTPVAANNGGIMKKTVLSAVAVGMVAAAALVAAPAQAATTKVNVQIKLVDSAILASDGVPAAKTACVTEDGVAAGATLQTPVVFKDKSGKVVGAGKITKVSLAYAGGDFAGFFTCTVSGVVSVDTAKAATVTVGKTAPVAVTAAGITKNKNFVKIELSAAE